MFKGQMSFYPDFLILTSLIVVEVSFFSAKVKICVSYEIVVIIVPTAQCITCLDLNNMRCAFCFDLMYIVIFCSVTPLFI